ncbi:MAG: DUF2723 domain-containing protein [Chloroflexi bacterium]|nr:DUF2723 domain-containing protein [Chloroflexota bacterium]
MVSIALAGASLLLYVLALAPTVLEGDSGEFQTYLYTLGIVHTTGYPLYTLVGHLFTWLPLGDVAYRVNLFSAVATALSVPLVYDIARRVLARMTAPQPRLLAVVVAGTCAVGYSVWSQAVVASVYGLNVLFVAAVLWLALRWSENVGQNDILPYPADRWFLALALVYGLSLAHHRTMLLWAPGLALFVLWVQPGLWRRGWLLVKAGTLALLPLLFYLYIPLRAWQLDDQRVLAGLIPWITGSDFGGHLGVGFAHMDVPAQLGRYLDLLVAQYTWIGVFLGLLGLVYLVRRRQARFVTLTGLAFLLVSVFALAYRYGDPMQATYNLHVYLLPAYLVWALWIGAGVAACVQICKSANLQIALCMLSALLPAWLLVANYGAVDMSRNDTVAQYARQVLAQPLALEALVFGEWDHITPLWYLQQVKGVRSDLTIIDAPVLDRTWSRYIAEEAAAGRPIYFYRGPTRTDAHYEIQSVGPAGYSYVARTDRPFRQVSVPGLVRIVPAAHDGQPAHALTVDFDQRVTLVGYDVEPALADAPDTGGLTVIPVTLYWRVGPNMDANYRVSLRLLDASGGTVAQMDKPANDYYDYRYPMKHWPADDTIRDPYALELPAGTPPGTYIIEVRVYGDAGDLPVMSDGAPAKFAHIGTLDYQ